MIVKLPNAKVVVKKYKNSDEKAIRTFRTSNADVWINA
jgi:hypothetical protein